MDRDKWKINTPTLWYAFVSPWNSEFISKYTIRRFDAMLGASSEGNIGVVILPSVIPNSATVRYEMNRQ